MEIRFNPSDEKDKEIIRNLLFLIEKQESVTGNVKQVTLESESEKATPKQIGYLKKLGFVGDPCKLSVKEASKEIERLGG